uniref:Uncharacterized protein n=1 Tax=Arundo donax TaxID=35708 RepID=A0A0A9GBI7_ARUDO
MPSSTVALYWMGTSMSAASANADSFCCGVVLLAMIDVKFTNWKLSKSRAGSLSSNFCMSSQGPSPTPTSTIDNG